MKKFEIISKTYIYILVVLLLLGCKKFIEVDAPSTSINTEQVYKNDATAAAALTAIYIQLSQGDVTPGNGLTSVSIDCGLYADELDYTRNVQNINSLLWTNSLTSTNGIQDDWRNIYNKIYQSNSAIEGLKHSNSLSADVKNQLLGEAIFIRGFCYFYLTNMFGSVPLAVTTDYKVNSLLSRSNQSDVYKQILNDFTAADSLLSSNYVGGDGKTPTSERVRPCKAAAEAMLARVYLYTKNFRQAEIFASKLINNSLTYDLVSVEDVFLKNSRETIWSIPSVNTSTAANTAEGRAFILSSTTNALAGPPYSLTSVVLNSFEPGDLRKLKWTGADLAQNSTRYDFVYKYKVGADLKPTMEYSIVLRLAEMYLIRAEARAMQNNLSEARDDLNTIRHRAGLLDVNAPDQDSFLNAVVQERQVELFAEWGHRFFDLKRLGILEKLAMEKPQSWTATDQNFPIPQGDRDKDPNLSQNDGY
ncbi:MAG TPA: RagB/SusD family nutrient uptake outer membrane protein [Mucilaginibacter sp.]|nr:RagB/SusD family nutrient uptake outer membrane protein [Mucilaginibacter sp.]